MKKEKLPILRWSLDAFGLLCLLLMVYFLDSCSKQLPSAETGLCSYPLGIIISGVLFFLFVVIAVRDLIQHPKQHKILLSLFAMIAIYTLFYNLRWGGDSIIKIMILMLFFPSVFIFFLWNRNKTENHIHLLKNEQIYCTPKHDIWHFLLSHVFIVHYAMVYMAMDGILFF